MECRIASAADKKSVVESFPGLYRGTDYLAHDYDMYMKSANYTCFVGVTEKEIVAFMYTKLLDRNQSYMIGAERVIEDHRGRGHMKKLNGYAEQYMKDKYPHIILKKRAYLENEEVIQKLQRHPEICIFATRASLWYVLSVNELRLKLSTFGNSLEHQPVEYSLNIRELCHISPAERIAIRSYLDRYGKEHNGFLGTYWIPYGNYKDNWEDILSTTTWVATERHTLQHQDGVLIKNLILIQQRQCELGMRYDIEFLWQNDALADLNVEVLFVLLRKLSLETPTTMNGLVLKVFCGNKHWTTMNNMMTMLVGKEHSSPLLNFLYAQENI